MNIPLNIDWQQILLHLFNFAILAGGLYVLLYKPVKDFMEKRTLYYQDMDRQAREALSEAESLKNSCQDRLDNADKEICLRQQRAEAQAQAQAEKRRKEASAEAEKILSKARKEAEAQRQKAVDEARGDILNLAVETTRKMLAEACEQREEPRKERSQ